MNHGLIKTWRNPDKTNLHIGRNHADVACGTCGVIVPPPLAAYPSTSQMMTEDYKDGSAKAGVWFCPECFSTHIRKEGTQRYGLVAAEVLRIAWLPGTPHPFCETCAKYGTCVSHDGSHTIIENGPDPISILRQRKALLDGTVNRLDWRDRVAIIERRLEALEDHFTIHPDAECCCEEHTRILGDDIYAAPVGHGAYRVSEEGSSACPSCPLHFHKGA